MQLFDRVKQIAFDLYEEDHCHRCFHVTFIVKKSKIQCIGVNSLKTNSKNLKYSYLRKDGVPSGYLSGSHSELTAFIKYGKLDCSDCTIINIRIDKNKEINNSKFCRQCQRLLSSIGYKKAYYSNAQGEFEEYKKPSNLSCVQS